MTFKVYLAGPISGLQFDESEDWRDEARRIWKDTNIIGYSPLRSKRFLKDGNVITGAYEKTFWSNQKSIMLRDSFDVFTADGVLVNLTNSAAKVSIGTVMEIAWAWQRRIPVVAIIEPNGTNIHEHPMLNEAIGWRVDNVTDGCNALSVIFNP